MSLLVVIGGPNGSGKTTLTKYLVERERINSEIINPDEIAFNEFGDYSFHVPAAKAALERRKHSISQKKEINDVLTAKSAGFTVILYYVALESMLDNLTRVEERTTNLGHHVEREDIVRRHEKSRINLIKHIGLFDKAYLFDNSDIHRSRVAIFENGELRWSNEKHKHHPFYEELLKK